MSVNGSMQVTREVATGLLLDEGRTQRKERFSECLEYQAPWLVERLCQHGVATTEEEANALFVELKRYLLLAHGQGERVVPMFSLRIDEVWHQFILFTADYSAFCERHFGHYLHHVPEQSTWLAQVPPNRAPGLPALTFEQFERVYAKSFGMLSELWSDAAAVTSSSRVTHAVEGLFCRESRERVELVRALDEQVVCRTGLRAANALSFIARKALFLVRELPDLNGEDEQLKLVRPLVQYGALRLKY